MPQIGYLCVCEVGLSSFRALAVQLLNIRRPRNQDEWAVWVQHRPRGRKAVSPGVLGKKDREIGRMGERVAGGRLEAGSMSRKGGDR